MTASGKIYAYYGKEKVKTCILLISIRTFQPSFMLSEQLGILGALKGPFTDFILYIRTY